METCRFLQYLHDYQCIKATAVVETSRLMQTRTKRSSRGIFPLSINIYGTHDDANEVGDKLSEIGAFLQHPLFLEPECEYFNPQYFHLEGEMKCMTSLVGLSENMYRAKRISDEVERVFDSLDTATRGDINIIPDSQPDAIITPLKRYGLPLRCMSVSNLVNSHQMVALTFIQRRENHGACQSANKSLRHFIGISSVTRKLQVYVSVV